MDYHIRFQSWLTIVVSVRKPWYSSHPSVSSTVFYKGSSLYSFEERVMDGILFNNYDREHALLEAASRLSWVFRLFPFIYKEFPEHLDYDSRGYIIRPYPLSSLPAGCTFEVEKFLINKNGEVYFVVNNSAEGRVMVSHTFFTFFPQIKKKYYISSSWDDSGLGFVSRRIIGKRFKVLKNGGAKGPCELEEL